MHWRQVNCESETREESCGQVLCADAAKADLSSFFGQAQCVYIDPPFCTGESFVMRQRVGEQGWKTGAPVVEMKAYSDVFLTREAYLDFLRTIVETARSLLSDTGAMFLHLDTRMDAYARILCDEIFGEKNFVNQIIWAYQSGGRSMKRYSRKHDVILFYQKSRKLYFDLTQTPLSRQDNRQNHMRRTTDAQGKPCRTIKSNGKTYVYYDDDPVYPGDVWTDVSHLQQKDPQRTGYDTQKPAVLMERIIKPVTRENDLVVDLCCGSGTFPVVAGTLHRRFLALDREKLAVSVTRKRLITQKVSFDVSAPCDMRTARIDIDMFNGIAYCDVCLNGFEPDFALPGMVTGLDAVDMWSVGYLREGRFHSFADAARTRGTPRLQTILQLPMLHGQPAVMISDIEGNRYCFVWDD